VSATVVLPVSLELLQEVATDIVKIIKAIIKRIEIAFFINIPPYLDFKIYNKVLLDVIIILKIFDIVNIIFAFFYFLTKSNTADCRIAFIFI